MKGLKGIPKGSKIPQNGNDINPIQHKWVQGFRVNLHQQTHRGGLYGQVSVTNPDGLGGVKSEIMRYEDSIVLYEEIAALVTNRI